MRSEEFINLSPEWKNESPLSESSLPGEPLELLREWIQQAIDLPALLPTAFALATSTFEGRPSSRMMMLRSLDYRQLYFYTNYQSKKGIQILSNPAASMLFFWPEFGRQVRIEGRVSKLGKRDSDSFFGKQDFGTQILAWASPQSQVVPNRKYLDTLRLDFKEEFGGGEWIDRPENWGGYALEPELVEFWQGMESGMHDRFQYRAQNGNWTIERLAP